MVTPPRARDRKSILVAALPLVPRLVKTQPIGAVCGRNRQCRELPGLQLWNLGRPFGYTHPVHASILVADRRGRVDGFMCSSTRRGSSRLLEWRRPHNPGSRRSPLRSSHCRSASSKEGWSLRELGNPDFLALLHSRHVPVCFHAFDLLEIFGRYLRDEPLDKRRAHLLRLLARSKASCSALATDCRWRCLGRSVYALASRALCASERVRLTDAACGPAGSRLKQSSGSREPIPARSSSWGEIATGRPVSYSVGYSFLSARDWRRATERRR
jgi:hypothetical protein